MAAGWVDARQGREVWEPPWRRSGVVISLITGSWLMFLMDDRLRGIARRGGISGCLD